VSAQGALLAWHIDEIWRQPSSCWYPLWGPGTQSPPDEQNFRESCKEKVENVCTWGLIARRLSQVASKSTTKRLSNKPWPHFNGIFMVLLVLRRAERERGGRTCRRRTANIGIYDFLFERKKRKKVFSLDQSYNERDIVKIILPAWVFFHPTWQTWENLADEFFSAPNHRAIYRKFACFIILLILRHSSSLIKYIIHFPSKIYVHTS